MAKSFVIRNIDNICVAANEVISRFTVNRNFAALLENDIYLADFYKKLFNQLDIKEYIDNQVYEYDDIIWFVDSSKDLWLLKCILDQNRLSPELAIHDLIDGKPNFGKYGWQDQNSYIDLRNPGIFEYINKFIFGSLSDHERDNHDHPFGKLSIDKQSEDYIGKKILFNDMTNIDVRRKNYFFPAATGHFQTNNIVNGTYRVWDNGIIEFDLVFKVGYHGINEFGQEVLSCNDVYFKNSTVYLKSSPEYQENYKYFQTTDDMYIFTNPHELKKYESSNEYSISGNRNKYVNTYFAELNMFPQPIQFQNKIITGFSDLDYMIFYSDELASSYNLTVNKLNPQYNTMTWCNKTIKSVTAIYITMPPPEELENDDFENFAKNGGIVQNSFTCHIIGRWNA